MTMKNRMKNLMISIRDKVAAKKKPKPVKPAFGAAKSPLTETRSRPSDKEMEEHYQHLKRVSTVFSGKPRPKAVFHEVKPLQFEPDYENKKEICPSMDIDYTVGLKFAQDTDPAYMAALDAFIAMNGGEEERKNVKPLTEPEKREYEKMVKKVFSAPDVD